MDTLKSSLRLALLAALSIAGVALGEDVPGITPGDLDFILSQQEVSALPIDLDSWLETFCGGDPGDGSMASRGECRLKVTNTPTGGGQNKGIQGTVSEIDPTAPLPFVSWRPTGLGLSGTEPVVTSCGVWDVSLDLDPAEPQPDSAIFLRPTEENPGRGLSAGILVLNVRLSLANRTTGQELDYPLVLGLGLAGPWSLAPTEESPGMVTQSNLLLFNDDGTIQCLPVEFLKIPAALEMYKRGICKLCVEVVSPSS